MLVFVIKNQFNQNAIREKQVKCAKIPTGSTCFQLSCKSPVIAVSHLSSQFFSILSSSKTFHFTKPQSPSPLFIIFHSKALQKVIRMFGKISCQNSFSIFRVKQTRSGARFRLRYFEMRRRQKIDSYPGLFAKSGARPVRSQTNCVNFVQFQTLWYILS